MLAACSNDPIEADGVKTPGQQSGNITFSAPASHTPNTRVALDGDMAGREITEEAETRTTIGNDGLTTHWNADDKVWVYMSVGEEYPTLEQYAIESIDTETGEATFTGGHSWGGEEGTPHHFRGCYLGEDVTVSALDWEAQTFSGPAAVQTQPGAASSHIGAGSILVVRPHTVRQPADTEFTEALQLRFRNAYPLLEFRFNAYDADVTIEYIEIESALETQVPLSFERVLFDIGNSEGHSEFTGDGEARYSIRLDVDHSGGNAYVPTTTAGGYFSARMQIIPGDHTGTDALKITVKTNKSETPHVFTRNGAKLEAGKRYTITRTLPTVWDGTSTTEPVSDGNTYYISTAAELAWAAANAGSLDYFNGKTLIQTADIDLGSHQWIGFGALSYSFKGTYDGGGNKVLNLKYENFSESYSGFFRWSSGIIRNLHVTGSVTGHNNTGGICGENLGTITGCSFSGVVMDDYTTAGGICGDNNGGTISDCVFSGSVTSAGVTGGICGHSRNNSIIANCLNTGNVHGNGNSSTAGICGSSAGNSVITGCGNTGTVTIIAGSVGNLGGICGMNNNATIRSCWNTGSISAIRRAGGICGDNWGDISGCWNTGSISGEFIGSICGTNNTTISSCYWGGDSAALDGYYGNSGTFTDCYRLGESDGAGGVRWPSADASKGWGIYIDDTTTPPADGYYWKSLGEWNGGNPIYPKLYWEED
jgi:hypothetical protein